MERDVQRGSWIPAGDALGRAVDWKLLFNQLFALEIKKEHVLGRTRRDAAEALDRLLRAFTLYTPETFNEALEAVTSAETSEAAYDRRVAHYENPRNRRLISDLDFARSVGDDLRRLERVRRFLEVIWKNKDRPIGEDEAFLDSPEGRNVVEGLRLDGGDDEQQVALVLVPGFAGHTIKYALFEEMVTDVNRHYGRPAERPLLREDGIDLEFEPHTKFYAGGDEGPRPFDILQPAGKELGNTTGANAETTEALLAWLDALPERYADAKLIFLGYSKGAPVVLDLVRLRPDIASRVLGYVSFAGVIQGTHAARLALEQTSEVLRGVSVGSFIERVRREEPTRLGRVLSPLFADVDLSWLSVPRIRAVFDILGYDIGPLERQIEQILGSRELHEVLDGARDLTPLERTRWNLSNLHDETFVEPAFVLTLSALTDVRDFVRPASLDPDEPEGRSLLVPALTPEGDLDWTSLSLDALFLYLTSIEGFKTAPGGLYDAQVDLAGTKLPIHDRRPLSDSLLSEELEDLWSDETLRERLERYGVERFDELAGTPRCDLIPAEHRSNLDAIDLGEFRGHHWSLFIQALRPPPELSKEHAVWAFPRKAFMRALIQLLAFYNVVRWADRGVAEPSVERRCEGDEAPCELRDVVFYRTEGVESEQTMLVNLYNLAARAVTYGIVANSARTGLGTAPPTGASLSTESLYYQALRLYSYFDWEFFRGVVHDDASWPLPRSLALIVGRFPGEFASSYPDEPFERLKEVRRALKVLAPGMEPFEVRRLGPGDYTLEQAGAVAFSRPLRENLWRGTRAKLEAIERDAYEPKEVGVKAKLEAMLGAFTPLCTVFAAGFDRERVAESSTRMIAYLPAFHLLHAEDLDDSASWYLEKGFGEYALSKPVRLATAEITHLRYLHEADPNKAQAMKLELFRDFGDRDRTTNVISFGRLFDGPSDELFAFDISDHRDALHVVFRPKLAYDSKDTPADRTFKDAFNRVFGAFEVEARIHQLTLHMHRRSPGSEVARADDAVLRPRFSLEESRISFRVRREVDTAVERLPLQAAGFTCQDQGPSATPRFSCYRDFWTWHHLRDEFFYGRLGSGRLALPRPLRERVFEQVLGTATQAVIDRSIESIEDAIDEEIARIAADALDRFSKTRTTLLERLHEGLF